MAIWVIKDGQREGPYEEQDLRELIYEGTYRGLDPAIRDGQNEWTTLGLILGYQSRSPHPAPESTLLPAPSAIPPVLPQTSAPSPVTPPPIPKAADPTPSKLSEPDASAPPIRVAVIDFEMPFGSMVSLMVKWVLASIPALLILGSIAAIFWTAFFALIAAVMRH